MGMISEFKEFAMKGNMMDMAVRLLLRQQTKFFWLKLEIF